MEIYYSPRACSLAARFAVYEANIDATFTRVDIITKTTETGGSFYDIAPKGKVAGLRLSDGSLLTENPAVLQYIADLKPESQLAPAAGTPERYRLQEWLSYVTSELHKQILWISFHPNIPAEAKQFVKKIAEKQLEYLSSQLEARKFLLGNSFTVADAYLTWALSMFDFAGISIEGYPAVKDYFESMIARPAVRRALDEETKLYAENL